MASRAGIWQRGIYLIEPSRAVATVLYGMLTVGGAAAVGALVLARRGAWPASWPPLPFEVAAWGVLVVAGLTVLLLAATVVNGRRWQTKRAIQRLSRDPAVQEAGPPAVQEPPAGPYAGPVPQLNVRVRRPPRFWQQPRGLRRVTETHNVLGRPPLQIVYLRVFENQPRSRTFVRGAWREFGYVTLLRSAAAVSPSQFRAAKQAGKLPGLFIHTRSRLAETLNGAPSAPQRPGWHVLGTIAGSSVLTFDRFGAYPVRSVTCHGSFWRTALDDLLDRADLVVLDLSGFRTKNEGTQFELQRIVDTYPISRVILLADPWSNRGFLTEQIHLAWRHMAQCSPNAAAPAEARLAVTDRYVQIQTQPAHGNAPAGTRTELRASRAQSRWLLARASGHGSFGGVPWRVLLPAAAVLAVAAVAVLVWPAVGDRFPGGGIDATVVIDHHVRAGPSRDFEILSDVRTGDEVVVDCLDQGWARLDEPVSGGYVSMEGLRFAETPPSC